MSSHLSTTLFAHTEGWQTHRAPIARVVVVVVTRARALARASANLMPGRRSRATTEPTKSTVGDALRGVEARVRRLEFERARDAERADARDEACERLARGLDEVVRAFQRTVDALRDDHERWGREREGLRREVSRAARAAVDAREDAETREAEARRARERALAIDERVTACVEYAREVRDEFVIAEKFAREAEATMGKMEARDAARERAVDELEERCRAADAMLRDELESVRMETSRAERAVEKAGEISGLASDVRALAKWTKETAAYQNRRLAALERASEDDVGGGTSTSGSRKHEELVMSVRATAQALKTNGARLTAAEDRDASRARRDAATRADVDVVKRALGEHHDVLVKVCENFQTELGLDVRKIAPTSVAFTGR